MLILNQKMNRLILFCLAIIFSISCSPQKKSNIHFNPAVNSKFTIHNECKKYFDDCGVNGSVAIFDNNNQHWIVSDTQAVMTESLPASTFKIINLLIALETNTIKDENEIVKWVGKTDTIKYGYRPEIYHDMSVKEAFEVSAGWVFIELAKKIGRQEYKKYLAACNYGNLNLSERNDDFWNFGDFAISPLNQAAFIKNLYEEQLPFSKRNIAIVKRVMITEQTDNYTIHAKTGWTRDRGVNTGWWVGYIETGNNTLFFATRLLQNRKKNRDDFGTCRKTITKRILSDLGLINFPGEQGKENDSLFKAIDHVPVAVNDLEKVKNILTTGLHFTLKDGKNHEGIRNCFVKFEDGTYLELISPTDSVYTIGKYYTDFLKTRQGGTSLAISITNSDRVKKILQEKNMQFTVDSNRVWQTIEPEKVNLFFIEYADKKRKERPANTIHPNSANSLQAVYILTKNMDAATEKYKLLGFKETGSGEYAGIPYKLFKTGQNNLYVLDGTKSGKADQLLISKNTEGICGFHIRVGSLQQFNKLVTQGKNAVYEKNSTTVYLNEYHLFLKFTE